MRPPVLVLDEPLSDLDPVGAQEVLATLQRLARRGGTGVIVIEHRVDEVAHVGRPGGADGRRARRPRTSRPARPGRSPARGGPPGSAFPTRSGWRTRFPGPSAARPPAVGGGGRRRRQGHLVRGGAGGGGHGARCRRGTAGRAAGQPVANPAL